jgi:hypothetical protein
VQRKNYLCPNGLVKIFTELLRKGSKGQGKERKERERILLKQTAGYRYYIPRLKADF